MANEVYNLAILLSLKDGASSGLDRFKAKILATGKDGEKFLKTFEQIRSEMNKGLAMGAFGVSSLAVMAKGVQIAADYQSSITELRSSFTQLNRDGSTNTAKLAGDMQRAEVVAMRLGNQLPGTTEDFVQMMQVLRQNGLDTDTIINGAADAVGNLAVATKSVPREIAGDVAKYGNLFKLKASEFVPAADVFSRIYTSTGQTTAELIEAAKYFQGRAGQNLGISGLKDAEQITRLFGFMGKQGMSGSMAGMGLTNFFESYNQHRDKLKGLEKSTGIKLDFFDAKGAFVGMTEVMRQMEQFNKLTDKDRTAWMSEMFGTLGMGAGNILANGKAWQAFNAEQDKTIGLAAKNAEVSKNFNNQLEALTGSLKNLVVTGFGPLLPSLTSGAEKVNAMVGGIQEFAKANPTLTTFLAKFALIGSTAMVAYGGLKFVYNGLQLLSFASKFSSEERVTSFLQKLRQNAESAVPATNNVAGAVTNAGNAVVATEKKVAGSVSRLNRAASSPITITLGLIAAGMTIDQLLGYLAEVNERTAKTAENLKSLNQSWDANMMGLYNSPGDKKGRSSEDQIASQFLNTISEGGLLDRNLHIEKMGYREMLLGGTPYGVSKTGPSNFWGTPTVQFNPATAARRWESMGGGVAMRDPNVIASIVRQLNMTAGERGMNLRDVEMITAAIEKMAGPEKWNTVKDILAKEKPAAAPVAPGVFQPNQMYNPFPSIGSLPTGGMNFQKPVIDLSTGLMQLQPPLTTTTQGFDALQGPIKDLPAGFQRVRGSADGLSSALDTVSSRLSSWTPPVASGSAFVTGPDGQPVAVPSNAVGGHIERDGFAYVHAGNTIVPAKKRAFEDGNALSVTYSPQITINGGDAKAKAEFAAMLYDHKRDIENIVAGRYRRGRERS